MSTVTESLGHICDNVQWWLDYNGRLHIAEPSPDTHVINDGYQNTPPVWPTRGQLTRWIEVFREAQKIEADNTTLRAENQALRDETARLMRGEFICQKCGLRKDSEAGGGADF